MTGRTARWTAARPSGDALEAVARAVFPAALLLVVVRALEAHALVGGYDAFSYWHGAHVFALRGDPYVDPTFVTPPSGLLLVAPLAAVSFRFAYAALTALSAAAFVAAFALLGRLFGERRRFVVLTASCLAVAAMSGTFQTLGFGNVNAFVLLAWVLSLRALDGGRSVRSGAWLGLSLALKPVLLPVLLLLLVLRRWREAGAAVGVPAGLAALGAAYDPHVMRFVRTTVPNLLHGLDDRFVRFDMSLHAVGRQFGAPAALVGLARVATVAVGVAIAVYVWRKAASDHPVVRLVETSTVLLLVTFLVGSFAWRYYTVFLVPLVATALVRSSAVRNGAAALSVALWAAPDSLGISAVRQALVRPDGLRPTAGLALLLLAIAVGARRRAAATAAEPVAVPYQSEGDPLAATRPAASG